MATKNAPYAEPSAPSNTVAFYGLLGILGTGWIKTTGAIRMA